jgi:DNA-binding response OmpR family regulator
MVISENAMGKRILIADDSVTIQKAFAMTLVAEDFALTTARSADEGLTLARQLRPDLVIADATMPGRSGYDLCAALKADSALRGTTVYILASSQQPYDDAKGRQVGADGHLLKPWESGALIEKVKEGVSRAPGAAARPVAAPPIGRVSTVLPSAALGDFDVDMDAPRDTAREAPAARPTAPAAAATPVRAPQAPLAAPTGGMRPSLIPGVRPGVMPPARPGTSPNRTLSGTTQSPSVTVPPRPTSSPQVGRTLFGLPAASMPYPGSVRPSAPAPAPAPAHVPAPLPVTMPAYTAPRPAPSPAVSAHVSSVVDQKVAAFAAKGPEYEAIARLSREIIEQIVWEVVPELAEVIIREYMEKRGRA